MAAEDSVCGMKIDEKKTPGIFQRKVNREKGNCSSGDRVPLKYCGTGADGRWNDGWWNDE